MSDLVVENNYFLRSLTDISVAVFSKTILFSSNSIRRIFKLLIEASTIPVIPSIRFTQGTDKPRRFASSFWLHPKNILAALICCAVKFIFSFWSVLACIVEKYLPLCQSINKIPKHNYCLR